MNEETEEELDISNNFINLNELQFYETKNLKIEVTMCLISSIREFYLNELIENPLNKLTTAICSTLHEKFAIVISNI